jgi:predicted ester cyclase
MTAAMLRAALPDWHSEFDQLVAEGDIVVERFHASGTHRDELMGVPGSGRTLVLHGLNIWRIDGAKSWNGGGSWTNWDYCANSGSPPADLPHAQATKRLKA